LHRVFPGSARHFSEAPQKKAFPKKPPKTDSRTRIENSAQRLSEEPLFRLLRTHVLEKKTRRPEQESLPNSFSSSAEARSGNFFDFEREQHFLNFIG
jgi:hypothetical protein